MGVCAGNLCSISAGRASSQKLERWMAKFWPHCGWAYTSWQFLSRVPAHAAIFESVELVKAARKRSAAPFVNAVLRKVAKTGVGELSRTLLNRPTRWRWRERCTSPWLVERWAEHYGIEGARQICTYNQTVPGTAIHIHDDQAHDEQAHDHQSDADLSAAGVQLSPGRLLSAARRVIAET